MKRKKLKFSVFNLQEKGIRSINFDKFVLDKIEERAQQTGSTVSNIVNSICRQSLIADAKFYAAMAKQHYLKFQEYHYMKEQCEIIVELSKK